MIFSTQFCRALIQKVKIRNNATFVCKGVDNGPKSISTAEILYEVGRLVILCQNMQHTILYYSLWWKNNL